MENTRVRILIVDDEAVVRESLTQWFMAEGYEVWAASGGIEALRLLQDHAADLALLDIQMPGMDGIDLQARLHEADPELTVIIMTGFASVDTAVRSLKQGAWDYLTKPIDPDQLSHVVAKALEHRQARRELRRLRESLEEMAPRVEVVGSSPAIRRVMELVDTVAATDATVLITGESGTGKEVVARSIHAASPRRHMPMVTIHCGALTETLLESELFGHERGAFTGAQFRKKGKFEVADGGTVFLDEISDISLKTQTDLLRVLQEKEIVRVGGTHALRVDFRCVAATNKRLEDLVQAGTFRPDLYYRLHVVTIDMPPLRNRREDIPLLVAHFLRKFAVAMNLPETPRLRPEAMDALLRYQWPGNVRELENAIERALVVGRGQEIGPAHFALHPPQNGSSAGGAPTYQPMSLDEVERLHIERVIKDANNNYSRAARILGIDRSTLYNKLRRYGTK